MNQGTFSRRLMLSVAITLSIGIASTGCMNWSAPRQVPVDPTARPMAQVPQPSAKSRPQPIPPRANGVMPVPRTVGREQTQGLPAPVTSPGVAPTVSSRIPTQAPPQTLRIPNTVGLPQAPQIAYPVTSAGAFAPNPALAQNPIAKASYNAPVVGSISDDAQSVHQPQVTPLAPLPENDPLHGSTRAAENLQRISNMFGGEGQLPPLPNRSSNSPASPPYAVTPLGPIPVTQPPRSQPSAMPEPPVMDRETFQLTDQSLGSNDAPTTLPAPPVIGPAPAPAAFSPEAPAQDPVSATIDDAARPATEIADLNSTPSESWPRPFNPSPSGEPAAETNGPEELELPDALEMPMVGLPPMPELPSDDSATAGEPQVVQPNQPPVPSNSTQVASNPNDPNGVADTNDLPLTLPPRPTDQGPSPSDVAESAEPDPPTSAQPPLNNAAESLAQTLALLRLEAEENRANEQDLRLLQLLEVVIHPEAQWPAKSPADEAWKRLATAAALQLRESDPGRTRQEVQQALQLLEKDAPLRLRNLAFCRQIDDFGIYAEFKSNGFQPGQELLVYVEIENFTHTESPNGMVVEIQGGYEILDSQGKVVDSREFLADKQTFRRERRDYYVPYRLFVPKEIADGQYTLRLKLVDGASQKKAEADISLPIRNRDAK